MIKYLLLLRSKNYRLLFLLFFSYGLLEAQQIQKNLTASNGQFIGFLEFKPYDYNSNSDKHPLIIFLHGIGERGDGTTQLNSVTANAIPRYCANGATMKFTYDGQQFSFIVLSPQLSPSYGIWEPFYVEEMIKYAKKNLRVDTNRIYLCGLSLGGGGTWRYATASAANSLGLAAIAPVCGTNDTYSGGICYMASQNLPVWAFHAEDDASVSFGNTTYIVGQMNGCSPTPGVVPKTTIYKTGGHGIWDRAMDTSHVFQSPLNMYEWMLSCKRTPPGGNQPPVASAGADVFINLPTNSTTLNGSNSYDPDAGGSIVSYSWSYISGPNQYTIATPSAASTNLTGLVQGVYSFLLVVTDNNGATGKDTVVVTVNAGSVNQPPIANAGSDISITLPTSSATLNGSASSDPDGTIASYSWSKVSGPAQFTIANPSSASTALTGLVQGTYVFKLLIADNVGATAEDQVTVTVNAAPNQLPVANAGSDITLTLPTNSTSLNGTTSSDPDGTISSYAWSNVSGPTQFTIANPSSSTTGLTNLVQGIYVFKLTVTDNTGATAEDQVTVTVNAAPNKLPIANAGSDILITLPTSSTTLNGSASSDPDGTIASYSWSKISGPTQFTIANASSASTALTSLLQGVYEFRLLVTDNNGATNADTVKVTVNPAPNKLPIANAGSDIVITLPTNSTTLNGSASSDPDGTIASYSWSKINGSTQFTIANASSASTALTGLVQGVYEFRLLVTDNNGATNADTVKVTVNPAPNQSPVANAGSDITITLPINSTTLNGTASSDADGTITSYVWTKVSGGSQFTIANANAASTALTNLAQGTYSFKLVVTDNFGATAEDIVNVTVNAAPNQSPVANAGADITITLPTNSTTLNGSGSSDADGTIASYAWTKITGPTQFTIANTTAATTALTNLVEGTYSFKLVVTDNLGATSEDVVNVTVNSVPPTVNQAPAANAGGAINITLPVNSVTVNGAGSVDADGTIVSYAWNKISGPAQFNIVNASSVSSGINNLIQGVYEFRLVVTDDNGATGADTVKVTVNASPNQPPVANAGGDISITLPANNVTVNGVASTDADGTIVSYAWDKISGPAQFNIENTSSVNSVINNLVEGVYEFRLVVTDDKGATDADTVKVTVIAASNQPPTANAGGDINIMLPVNNVTFNGAGSTDVDGSIVLYAWSKISGPPTYLIGNASSVTTTVSNLVQGTYRFQLTVTDNNGATDVDTVMVTVTAAPNQPPVADAGADIVVTLPNNSTNLNGSGSIDPDGVIASYEWTKISGPASFSLANAAEANCSLTNLTQGSYQFRLLITDNNGFSGADTVMVTVNAAPPPPNQPPVANAGGNIVLKLPVNSTTLNGSASSDADGNIVTYAWSKVSGPASFAIDKASSSVTSLTNLVQGTYQFRLLVTDNSGATDADTVLVTVNAALVIPNQPPIANAGGNINISWPLNKATLNGAASVDPDGVIVAYTWAWLSGPASYSLDNSSAATTSLTNLVQGTYSFQLTVTDDKGAIDRDTVLVIVKDPISQNIPPIANAGKDTVLNYPTTNVILNGAGSKDLDGVFMTYEWKQISGPSKAVVLNSRNIFTNVNELQAGEYVFELKVTDILGASSTDSIKVKVVNDFRFNVFYKLYPSPAGSYISYSYIDDTKGKLTISVLDAVGRLQMQQVVQKNQNLQIGRIVINELASGIYYLQIEQPEGKKKIVRAFVKQ